MRRQRKPYWIDCLHEKHECYDYDDPAAIEVEHGGRKVKVLMPSYLADVKVLVTAESDGLLFMVGRQVGKYVNDIAEGVMMVAKHVKGDTYAVGIWHELYSWALKHFGLVKDVKE